MCVNLYVKVIIRYICRQDVTSVYEHHLSTLLWRGMMVGCCIVDIRLFSSDEVEGLCVITKVVLPSECEDHFISPCRKSHNKRK